MTEQDYDRATKIREDLNEWGKYESRYKKFLMALRSKHAEYKIDSELIPDYPENADSKEYLIDLLEVGYASICARINYLKEEFAEL